MEQISSEIEKITLMCYFCALAASFGTSPLPSAGIALWNTGC